MNIIQAEFKFYMRSPVMWIVMAIVAFIGAWSFLLSIDLFTQMQVKFANMTDAPTITQGVIFPVISAYAKIMVLVVSIIAGMSFSRLSQNNAWGILRASHQSDWSIVWQKFMGVLSVILLFFTPIIIALCVFIWMTDIDFYSVFIALIGLFLLVVWMLSLTLLLSSWLENTGFAILFSLLILIGFYLFSQSIIGPQWGKNWIQVMTPFYHFKQFITNYISYASVYYFLGSSGLFLWATKIRLLHKRYILE